MLYTHHNRRKEKRPRMRICGIIIHNIIAYVILYCMSSERRRIFYEDNLFRELSLFAVAAAVRFYIICMTAAAGGKRDLARDASVLRPCINQYVRERMRFYHDIIIIILRIFGRR